MNQATHVTISTTTFIRTLFAVVGAFAVAAAMRIVITELDVDFVGKGLFMKQFRPAAENNLVTWFSSVLHLTASALLIVIGRATPKVTGSYRRHWLILSAIFLLLSIDEAASIHEYLGDYLDARVETAGYFYWPWVIPGLLFAALIGLTYLRFLLRLPRHIGILFVLSGILFVGGAVGMESIQANHDYLGQAWSSTDSLLVIAEETLEMFGVALFIFALLTYVRQKWGVLSVAILPFGTKSNTG